MKTKKSDIDNGCRFLIDAKLYEKFKSKIRSSGYSNVSEFLREKIRDFVYEVEKNEHNSCRP